MAVLVAGTCPVGVGVTHLQGIPCPKSRTLEGRKELLSVGSLSWDMPLPSLGTEPRDIGQAAGREITEKASVSSLWVTGLITDSAHRFFLLRDLV